MNELTEQQCNWVKANARALSFSREFADMVDQVQVTVESLDGRLVTAETSGEALKVITSPSFWETHEQERVELLHDQILFIQGKK